LCRTVFFFWPMGRMIGMGSLTDAGWQLGAFAEVLSESRIQRIVGQTLLLAGGATVTSVLLAIPGAYVLYRCDFRGRGFFRALVIVPFVLPTVVVGVAFRALVVSTAALGVVDAGGTGPAVTAARGFMNAGP